MPGSAAAINPSDVKNVAGAFKTQLPRTPGRDYAGTVVAGEGKGRAIGAAALASASSGTARMQSSIAVAASALADKPHQLSMARRHPLGCHS